MRTFLLTLLALIFSCKQTNAQFNSMTNCNGNNGIGHSVFFINADTGFVAGEAFGKGVIQKTTDGGNSWNNVYTSTANLEWVEDIAFTDATNGVAVGANGTVLQTANGGSNWNVQTIANVTSFNAVSFANSNVGYAVGYGPGNPKSRVYKTTNGGANWNIQNTGADSTLRSVYFLSPDTGYAVGNYDLIKTTNGGATWNRTGLNYPTFGSEEHIELFCINDSTCFIPFDGIQRTSNSGATWNPVSLPAVSAPYMYYINAIHFTDANTGFAVGAYLNTSSFTYTGTILKTSDAGLTWTSINTSANNTTLVQKALSSVKFVNPQTGYTIGDLGEGLKTTNGGGIVTGIATKSNSYTELSIYPNPAKEQIVIETSETDKQVLYLYDIHGKHLLTKNMSGKTIIDVTTFEEGVYTISIKGNSGITNRKLVVIH